MKTRKKGIIYKKKIRGGDGEVVPYANSESTKANAEGANAEGANAESIGNDDANNFPLLQPVEIPSIVKLPFKVTKNVFDWGVGKIKDSTILNAIPRFIYSSLKNSLGSFNNLLTNNEITSLINEMIKNFIIFFGSMLKEVGEDIANEFLEIFFELLLNVGTKLVIGFSNVGIKLLMSAIGEIPVAGGFVDLFVTIVTSFNDVIRVITPIIKSSLKTISAGIDMFNKTSNDIMNNPNFNSLKGNVSQFSAKVFGGFTFFGFISNMFSKLKNSVSNLFGSYSDNVKNRLKNVSNSAFDYGKQISDNLDQQYNPTNNNAVSTSSSNSANASSNSANASSDADAQEEAEALKYFGYTSLNDVTRDDLRQKYKQLSLKYHPDKNQDNKDESEQKFKELSKYYSYLMKKKGFSGGGIRRTRKRYCKKRYCNKQNQKKSIKKQKKSSKKRRI
jgi:hypothetical protein